LSNLVGFCSSLVCCYMDRHSGTTSFKTVKNVNCTLVQAPRLCTGPTARRGSRGIALLFLDHGTGRGEGAASRPGRSLPQGKTRYLLYRRLGGPQCRSGRVRKISPPNGIRSPDRPARNHSLSRLCYSTQLKTVVVE
jgi:hypothetical protein